MLSVKNMISEKSGREVANQFIIYDDTNCICTFQSYNSPIVTIDRIKMIITIHPDYNYSRTTVKYRNSFMYRMGFFDMDNTKGFEYYKNLGAIGSFEIITL